jgi:hypothetical protein
MKQQTPQKVLIDILKGCNPIATMFIMDAIAKQSDRVLENREQTIDAMKNSFVHGEAWVNTAEQLQKVLGLSK